MSFRQKLHTDRLSIGRVFSLAEGENPVLLPAPLVDPDTARSLAAPIESPKTPAF
jgi:hypothetical protein